MSRSLAIAGVVIRELYRRKDFYVLFILTALVTLVLGSVNFFNDDRVVRYLKEVCLLLIWLSTLAMAVVATARQIPAEIESRTIFPLLAKPVRRSQVVVGKFLGCWFACGVALLVFYVFFGVISASRERELLVTSYLQVLWMHWIALGLLVALSLLGSVLFAAPSSNATIVLVLAIAVLMVGQHLNQVAANLPFPSGTLLSAIYFALPHLEFYDLRSVVIHNWPARDWGMVGWATLYGGVYTAALLAAACALFQRKTLNP
jgi:ABC-type transport system involved in multi-copper enzyme maturation permease subunit